MLWIYLLLLLVVLLMVVDRIKCKKTTTFYEQTKTNYPYVPFIGHLYLFVGNDKEFIHCINDLAHQAYKNVHGITSIWMGPNMMYPFISDAEPAKLVLKYCLDKGHLIKLSKHLFGNGSIFAPVDIWQPRRKILSRATASKYVRNFFDVFVRNSHAVLEELESVTGKGDFSLWNYISNFTLNVACETVFGEDLQLQKKIDHPFVNAFVEYFKNIGARLLQFWLHSDTIYKLLPVYKTQSDMKDILHEFSKQLIRKGTKALQAKKAQEYSSDHDIKGINIGKVEDSFLDLLIKFSGITKEYSELELMEETLVLLLAATDTMASTACFTLLLLSQYPDVQDKVYNELYEVFGDTESKIITINDITTLTYLDAVLKETLRLYPAAPIIVRRCEKDFELPSGLVVCENTEVVTSIWGIHRNPKHWGTDAEQFKPERFLSATPEQLSAFIPFSYGNRNCVGGWYAMHLLKVLLVSILRRYRVKPASYTYEEDKGFRVKYDVILKHVDNFEVRLERRV